MALARADHVTFSYPGQALPALADASLTLEPGEIVAVFGPSGSGKSTLLRIFAGLVPHFHGGGFAGRVEVGGLDTRLVRPADLAGTVAMVFQDPEDQVIMDGVENEVAFGLENLGTPPAQIRARVASALGDVGAGLLGARSVTHLSSGQLQRVCLAAAHALEPRLLLLDEPTSQLDPGAADRLIELAARLARDRGLAVLISEQRPARPLEVADRVLFLEGGRIVLDAWRDDALRWLARNRPAYVEEAPGPLAASTSGAPLCRLENVSFRYGGDPLVLDGASLELGRGEIVALTGPNGSGKTTLAKIAAGLLEAQSGRVARQGRAAYLSQDPGRYLVRERADAEVALGVRGDVGRARRALARVGLAGFEARHPRDLSSGERERLALAAVIVTEPDVLILDEPTRGMDPDRKRELARLLREDAGGRTTLVVTHDLPFAASISDRRVSLGATRELALA